MRGAQVKQIRRKFFAEKYLKAGDI